MLGWLSFHEADFLNAAELNATVLTEARSWLPSLNPA
jgi:hypothetical protein